MTVALPILVTSRAAVKFTVEAQAFVTSFLETFRSSVTFRPNIHYKLYIGYDRGDALYDNVDNRKRFDQLINDKIGSLGVDVKVHLFAFGILT